LFINEDRLPLVVNYRIFGKLCLSWVDNDYTG
jgi:hypothetical protein